jgi:hypothetical protein
MIPTDASSIVEWPKALADILDSVPKLASAIAALSIAIAIAFQLGYFFAIDARLFSYLTIQDALLDALKVFPIATLFPAVMYFAIGPWGRYSRKSLKRSLVFLATPLVIAAAGFFFMWRQPHGASNALASAFIGVLGGLAVFLGGLEKPLRVTAPIYYIFVLLISASYGFGLAKRDLARDQYDSRLT